MPDLIKSNQRFFGVPDTYTDANTFFPEASGDAAWRNQLEGNQPQAPAGDEFDPQDYQIASQTSDPFKVFELAGQLRQKAHAGRIIEGMSKINPKMPDFLEQYNNLLAQNRFGVTDPDVVAMSKINTSRAALAQPKTPSYKNDLHIQAAQAGVPIEDINSLKNPDGSYDEVALASKMGEAQRQAKVKPVDESDWMQTIPPKFANRASQAVKDLSTYAAKLGSEQGDEKKGVTALQENIANRNAVVGAVNALRGYKLTPDQIAEQLAAAGLNSDDWMGGSPPATYEPTDLEKDAAVAKEKLVDAQGKPDYHAAYYRAQGLPVPKIRSESPSRTRLPSVLTTPIGAAPEQVQSAPAAQQDQPRMSFAQRMLAEQAAQQKQQEEAAQVPVNEAFTSAKTGLEKQLKDSGLSDQDLMEVYRGIANGDEVIPTNPPETRPGVPQSVSGESLVPTSAFVLNRAKIAPDKELFKHPIEDRSVTAQEVLKDLADEKLKAAGENGKAGASAAPIINSVDQYNALPVGTVYTDSTGRTLRKK